MLTQGHISDRLQNVEHRLLLLDYLATELMAARILQEKKPDKKIELKLVCKNRTLKYLNLISFVARNRRSCKFKKDIDDFTIS